MLAKSLRRTAGFSEQNERKTAFKNVAMHRFIEQSPLSNKKTS